jgi:hypothetical protein
MANANGVPHSFVVDMGAAPHAPVRSHPRRVQVRVRMAHPRPDGLRDVSELEALGKVEDAIVARVEEGLEGIYVGRYLGAGFVTLVFYVPEPAASIDDELENLDLEAAVRSFGPYTPQSASAIDAAWSFYLEFLYPDEVSLQQMLNRDQLRHREELGDCLDVPRTIDHLVVFASRVAADGAARALAAAGFRVDPVRESTEGQPPRTTFRLEFHRDERLDGNRPDAFCADIRALIAPFDGDYDGWGAAVVKRE